MTDNLNPHSTGNFNPGSSGTTVIKVTSISMMITAIFIFVVIIFILFLCLQAHYTLGSRPARTRPWIGRRRGNPIFVFSATSEPPGGSGIDPAALAALPITIYQSREFVECAVCLAELADGEKARFLPKCNHGFHVECIDTWFRCNSTCPVCRGPVDGEIERRELELDGEMTEVTVEVMEVVGLPESSPPELPPENLGRVCDVEEGFRRNGEGSSVDVVN